MADLTQSSQVTSTAPTGALGTAYTNAATNIANNATAAGSNIVGANGALTTQAVSAYDPNALKTQAFTNVANNVGNYQPGLTQAGQNFTDAGRLNIPGAAQPFLTAGTTTSGLTAANPYLTSGTSSAADLVGGYMNPYTQNEVDQIRLANQQNIQQNLSPGLTAGAVGGGQFGSQRGANALSLGISNANIGALGQQAQALQSGYAQALAAAQQQRANQLQAGQTAGTLQNQANINQVNAGQIAGNMTTNQGNLLRDVGTAQAALANQTQNQGLADVNALSTLGAQKQAIAQNKLLAPLEVLAKQGATLSGLQVPTATTTTANGSPLSAIAGLGSLGVGLMTPATGTVTAANPKGISALDKLISMLPSFTSTPSTPNNPQPLDPNITYDPATNTYHDAAGQLTDEFGNIL
jgi:hypothetical protein